MELGYILKTNNGFKFRKEKFTRRVSEKSDRVYCKMLQFPVDYEEVEGNANIMKKNPSLILVSEPFILDSELEDKVTKWVDWANSVDPSEYDPFYKEDLR